MAEPRPNGVGPTAPSSPTPQPKSEEQTKTGCTPRASDDTLAASAPISTFS